MIVICNYHLQLVVFPIGCIHWDTAQFVPDRELKVGFAAFRFGQCLSGF